MMPDVGSTATPSGLENNAPLLVPSPLPSIPGVPARVVTTVGGKLGSVEYWKTVVVSLPPGMTVAFKTALVPVTVVAARVVTAGGVLKKETIALVLVPA